MGRRSSGNQQKHESGNPIQRKLLDRFHSEIARLVQRVDPDTIADLGCGEAYVLDELLDRGVTAQLTGIDRSPAAIAAARSRLGERACLVESDVTELQPTIGRFDLVMMLEVLEHLDDPERALDLLAAVSSSHILVSVPREPFFRGLNLLRLKNVKRWGSDPEHVQHWSRRSFTNLVESRFDIVDRGDAFPWTVLLLTK